MSEAFRELSTIIVETIPNPWLTLDADLRVIAANRSFYQIFHVSFQEIENQFIYELGDGQWNLPALRTALEQVMLEGVPLEHLEVNHDLAAASQRTLLVNARRINNEQTGTPTALVFFEDITERKRAEDALIESEAKYRTVFEAAHDIILLLDGDGNILDINRRAEPVLGYSLAEIRRMNTFKNLCIPEDRALMQQVVKDVSEGHSREYKVRWQAKDGQVATLAASSAPQFSDRGDFLSAICTMRDITDSKRTEQALRANDLRFQALIENCLDGILLSTADGTMLYLSPAATRIIGYTVEEILNKNRFDLIHPDDIAECRIAWTDILQQPGQALSHEYRLRHRDGTWLWIECISCNKLADPDIGAVIGNYRDISGRKKMEAEMINAEMLRLEIENEKEIIKLKENFISQVSHDFRTPLSVIQASSDLLGRYFDQIPPSKRVKFLRDIQLQIKYMVELLDDVVTADRAHSGKFKPELASLDVMAFCRGIMEQLQLTDQGEHQLMFVTEGDVHDARTDENFLRRILDNLLSNAIKYSPSGSDILFAVTSQDNEFLFQVTDHGIGIPSDDQKHLFDEFHRARNTGNIRGTGLGLAIVKSNVDVLGGTITCESREGEGTTFWVRLPTNMPSS